ncbi:hypothetical protein D3C87_1898090 [compost metagenome]
MTPIFFFLMVAVPITVFVAVSIEIWMTSLAFGCLEISLYLPISCGASNFHASETSITVFAEISLQVWRIISAAVSLLLAFARSMMLIPSFVTAMA